MKKLTILLLSLILFTAGCSFYKSISNRYILEVVNAGFSEWTKPPAQNSDVPTKGVDLAVIVKNWHEDVKPEFIVYKNRKSSKPEVKKNTDAGAVISAEIVLSGGPNTKTSEQVELSDALVYKNAKGETEFLYIEEWTKINPQ